MFSEAVPDRGENPKLAPQNHLPDGEKVDEDVFQPKIVPVPEDDYYYDNNEDEPELHVRTYLALAAMFLLNMVQVLALQGPPAVVRNHLTNLTRWKLWRLTFFESSLTTLDKT
jgi:hypothetical protein